VARRNGNIFITGNSYEGSSVLAAIKVIKTMGYVAEYRWAFGLDDLVLAVGYKGPAVLGTNWYEEMFYPDDKGAIRVGGEVAGGHAYLVKGVSVSNRTFTIHNSWGAGWGVGGDAKISWDHVRQLLAEQGEAVIPLVRTSPV
jgi:hypothetical protein